MEKEELKNIELIENYFEKKLSARDMANFEARMVIDNDFKEEVELYQNIVLSIKEAGQNRLKSLLQNADKELENNSGKIINLFPGNPKEQSKSNNTDNPTKKKPAKFNILLLVASFTLLFGIGLSYLIYTHNSNSNQFQVFDFKEGGLPNKMGCSSILDSAMIDFKQAQYQQTINQLLALKSQNDTTIYFIGYCQERLKQQELAMQTYSKISIQSNSKYSMRAAYRRALLLIKKNKKSEAKRLLIELSKIQPNEFSSQAEAILSKLN